MAPMQVGGSVVEWFRHLSDRLARVRIAHGDWARVIGDSVTWNNAVTRGHPTAVFLDPPYDQTLRSECYAVETSCSAAVRSWAIEAGKRDDMRICLAGYNNEHVMPDNWVALPWKARGGMGNQGEGRGRENAGREMLWFSPACLSPDQPKLI